ncbi:MAG TPA: PAS domain S-box protein [Longimicrobiales bacterium]
MRKVPAAERHAGFMAEASRILASSLDYGRTLRNVAELAVPAVADWCAIDVVENGEIQRVAVQHVDSSKARFVHQLQQRYPPDPAAPRGSAHVIRTGQVELVSEISDEDLRAVARDDEHLRLIRELGLRSYVAAPLRVRDRTLGAITLVYAESGRTYREDDRVFIEDLARRAATAIENARLVRALQQSRAHAEEQAAELEAQAVELETQASELETLNQDLREAEARLRGIIDSALDAVVTSDGQSVITGWNRHAEVMFGWTAREAIGRNLTETIIPPQHREAHRIGVERYLATGEKRIMNRRIEITAMRRDGTEFPVELTVASAQAGSRTIFSAFIRDITERVEAQRRIAAEHAVTRILAESHTLDAAAPRVLEAIGTSLQWTTGGFWVIDPAGDRLHLVGTWHDADARVSAFVELTERTSFERGSGLPGRVWEQQQPVWVEDITNDATFPRVAAAIESGLHGAVAFPVRAGDEMLGVIEFFHTSIMSPDDGLLTALEVIGSGIGQSVRRVRAEEERDRALRAIEEANARLAQRTVEAESANRTKSEFLATMSHELRTPINAIMGYTDLLDAEIAGALNDAQRDHLRRISASSRHLLGLVEDVLDLAKIDAGRITVVREPAPVLVPVRAAIDLITPQAHERDLVIGNRCRPDAEARFMGDSDRVQQILVNLLSNAIKFTEPGGSITVHCAFLRSPDDGAHLDGAGPWVAIMVDDTGIGIAPDQVAAVFEPFVQAETGPTRRKGGTGLGLTISRQLARLMGGDLTVVSTPGRGSCFKLWLQAADPDRA